PLRFARSLRHRIGRTLLALYSLLENLKHESLSQFHAGGAQQCSHCASCAALLPNDLPEILWRDSQFENDSRVLIDLGDRHLLGVIDERFCNGLDDFLE